MEIQHNMERKKASILDCTIRDGGYYTNWRFTQEFVRDYIAICRRLDIDFVELGYLRLADIAYERFDDLFSPLSAVDSTSTKAKSNTKFGVMIDAKEMLRFPREEVQSLIQRYTERQPFQIDMIRVAMHFTAVGACASYIEDLKNQGFHVCINLMQIDLANQNQIDVCLNELCKINFVDTVYLADSFGGMLPWKVKHLVGHFAKEVRANIGFHAHDNIGLALHNTLVAIDAGASIVDGTIYGMGRGAGNVNTEHLIPLLRQDISLDNLNALHEFVAKRLCKIRDQYGWGSNVFYGIAGISKIHPSYVQLLQGKEKVSTEAMVRVLSFLSKTDASTFADSLLEEAIRDA